MIVLKGSIDLSRVASELFSSSFEIPSESYSRLLATFDPLRLFLSDRLSPLPARAFVAPLTLCLVRSEAKLQLQVATRAGRALNRVSRNLDTNNGLSLFRNVTTPTECKQEASRLHVSQFVNVN